MSRMKTFAIYLLLFIGLYVVSNILISALIKTSYYKIDSYEIKESQLTVTIMNAKASKDNGYIEGKISNSSDEDVYNKYMKVELFSENNVSLGKEYVKVDEMKKNDVKNFTVNFNYDIVKHFVITFLTPEEKTAEEPKGISFPEIKRDLNVSNIINQIEKH